MYSNVNKTVFPRPRCRPRLQISRPRPRPWLTTPTSGV